MKSVLAILAISGLMFGCANSKKDASAESAEVPTYTEAEFGSALGSIGTAKDNVAKRGLVLDENGRSWEPNRYEQFKKLPVAQQKEAIADLELLKSNTTTVLAKFSGNYNLQLKAGGVKQASGLAPGLGPLIENYRQMAISELERLNGLQESAIPQEQTPAPAAPVTPPKKDEVKPPAKKPVPAKPPQRSKK